MDMQFLFLGGYGLYVWPAFIFTFIVCFTLYLKTKKELQRQEKIFFKEFGQVQKIKIEVGKKKENIKEAFTSSSI
jgi:heme exporter protein D